MKIILVLLLLPATLLAQSQPKTGNDRDSISGLYQSYSQMREQVKNLEKQHYVLQNELKILRQANRVSIDSLAESLGKKNRTIMRMQLTIDSLSAFLLQYHAEFQSNTEAEGRRYSRIKNTGVSLFILTILLLSGVFLFLFYRDNKLEYIYLNQLRNYSSETDRRMNKLSRKWKARFSKMKKYTRRKKGRKK